MSVLLGVALTAAVAAYFYRDSTTTVGAARAARVAAIVRQAERTRSDADLEAVLALAQRARVEVEELPVAQVAAPPRGRWRSVSMRRSIEEELEHTWGITPLSCCDAAGAADSIVVDIGAGRALAFEEVSAGVARRVLAGGAILIIAVVIFGMLLLSLYAVRWVTAPLSSIAAAARAFGQAPGQGQPLSEDGPREIAQVAAAMNEMRERIRALVEERTRLLLAISHDLRTPLTRLRLRVERVAEPALRESMMNDVVAVTGMLGETLSYLRDGGRSESPRRVDLPSLLRTVCGEFTDVGHTVTYEGPPRLAVICRDRALARAVTNVVENATKHGKVVWVGLTILSPTRLQIEVSDDGPGIPVELREKVLEPFFKVDPARQDAAGRGGFGLGLAITRDIMRAHGGDIVLTGNERGGLTVQLCLMTHGTEPSQAVPDAPSVVI